MYQMNDDFVDPLWKDEQDARKYGSRKAAEPVQQLKRAMFELITATDLMAKEFREPQWAVPEFVPEGLTLLAGKPKTGKSWLALDFAVAVAAGSCAMGNVTCKRGDVLYLALEDTQRRLHGRLKAVLQGAEAPDGLNIATEWRRSDGGGLEDLRHWLGIHVGIARLIVIDTLQKIRGARKKDAGVYEDDYRAIAD